MKKVLFPLFVLLALPLIHSGCSVFTPIGDAISHVYENTVSYFNAYYNAKQAFDDAENEIRIATSAARSPGQKRTNRFVVPASSKQKLTVVIDKCSSLLTFHSTSSFVDNTLVLLGKSHFYLEEFTKAERKFAELIEQYPSSSFVLEAKLWQARSLVRLGKAEEALKNAEVLAAESERLGEEEAAATALLLAASLYEGFGNQQKAVAQYERVTALTSDDEVLAETDLRLADLYFSSGQYDKAVSAYYKAAELTSDVASGYQAKLQAAVALSERKAFNEALEVTDDLARDFRYKEYAGTTRLERARILYAGDRKEEAIDEYRYLDTAFARTDVGPLASFRIGEFLEKEIGDYDSATTFFNRASLNRNTSVFEPARRKSTALTRYKELRRSVAHHESLLLVNMEHDSLTMNADSLRGLLARASAELGDIFETDLMMPDSAVAWYRWSLALGVDSVKSPRALFVLAEIAAAHPEKRFGDPRDYYHQIIEQFPRSKFADQSREIVGLPKREQQMDAAERLFVDAEREIEGERYEEALSALSAITARFPASPFAARSEYTIGWIYEHRLSKPDSALAHFRKLMEQHGSSKYAVAIRTRLAEAPAPLQDTTKIPPNVPQVKQKRVE